MADIPPIRPPAAAGGQPPTSGDAAPASDLPFGVGQRLFARVVQVLGEKAALLEMAGQRFATTTPSPLSPGQIIEVAVRGAGPVIDLELLDPPDTISERAYLLAAVLEARQVSPAPARVPLDAVRSLLQSLPAAAKPDGSATSEGDLRARAAATLLPPEVDADGSRLAARLRHAVRASGAFLEARLTSASGGADVDLAQVADDTRVILGELASRTRHAPALEATRAALAADALARQVDVAYHAVRNGELRLDLAVMAGASLTEVRLRVREEGGNSEGEPAAGRQIDLTIDLPELGRVRATVSWTPGCLATRFAVGGSPQADALRGDLAALDARLRTVGFRQVATRVDVDPEALVPDTEPPDPLLPGGSILRARA